LFAHVQINCLLAHAQLCSVYFVHQNQFIYLTLNSFNSVFFVHQNQLTALEVWLDYGTQVEQPPLQLPILLQVLLSQGLRVRVLVR
jgi:hypothetical protein